MPEGHSIRHLANVHNQWFVGSTVIMTSPQGRFSKEAAELDGFKFTATSTHGKHLFFHFDKKIVHVHLGLYGWFRFYRSSDTIADTSNIRMHIDTGRFVSSLSGPTKCELLDREQMFDIIDRLGPDPLDPRSNKEAAWEKISKSKKPIAALLMDQSVIAGIGNVYRAELLFLSKQNPFTPGNLIRRGAFDAIWRSARAYMGEGARDGTIRMVQPHHMSSRELDVLTDDMQSSYVYKRTGQLCRVCTTTLIASCLVNNRTLYWCPTCQP